MTWQIAAAIPGWLALAWLVTQGIGRAFFTGSGGHRNGWR